MAHPPNGMLFNIKNKEEEMTGNCKAKCVIAVRECYHVSKNKGGWTDICVPICTGSLWKEIQESKHQGSLWEGDLVAGSETEICFYCVLHGTVWIFFLTCACTAFEKKNCQIINNWAVSSLALWAPLGCPVDQTWSCDPEPCTTPDKQGTPAWQPCNRSAWF